MGNKLCAPLWKKSYRDEDHPWAPKKDSHLLRLWAEIFEVRVDGDEVYWARISDDVVPVNITCIQDTPDTVFQITAYNRHVEKIFDVKLIQPGTKITQASECFVHWRDSRYANEWGLNFTTPVDARRYRDCCMSSAGKVARKASSSGSLRLSPPKRVRGKNGKTQEATSPVSKPRRAISTPEELAYQDAVDAGFVMDDRSPTSMESGSQKSGHSDGMYTVPRTRHRQQTDPYGTVAREGIYQIPPSRLRPVNRVSNNVQNTQPAGPQGGGYAENREPIYATVKADHPTLERKDTYEDDEPQEVDDNANPRRLGKPELRQFSREPTVIRLSAHLDEQEEPDFKRYPINDISDDLNNITLQMQDLTANVNTAHTPLSPPRKSHSSSSPEWPPPPEPITPISPDTLSREGAQFDSFTLKRMLRNLPASASHSSIASNATNGNRHSGTFDEAAMQQQLREQLQQQLEQQLLIEQQQARQLQLQQSQLAKPLAQTQSKQTPQQPSTQPKEPQQTDPQQKSQSEAAQQQRQADRPVSESIDRKTPLGGEVAAGSDRPAMPSKPQNYTAQEYHALTMRPARSRDSYPDSGVGDTTASLKSGSSGRSSKSATLPPVNVSGFSMASHGAKSSTSTSSGPHSDHDHPSHGPHLASDASETESDHESSSGGATSDSSIHTMPTESQASFASKSAAVRKAGWLTVKNWLIHKKRKVELAPKRSWKKYWVCLKGTVLLFYACQDAETISENSIPRHMLVVEGGIAQAVPEHPKRECIFALSTAFGDAYLFQAENQVEHENWINGLHSACASSFARQHGKENTLKLLKTEVHKLENSIDIDIKMKKMADLQLTVVSDPRSKQAIEKQIMQWDENLEKLYVEQYRLRCYIASLQGSDSPNPKTLLTYVSKATKAALGRIGVFTVSSFHALVSARTPPTTANIYNKNKKRGLLSTFKADSVTKIRPRSPRSFSPNSSSGGAFKTNEMGEHILVDLAKHGEEPGDQPAASHDQFTLGDNLVKIMIPNSQTTVLGISDKMSVQEVLDAACNKRQLNPNDHFIRFKLAGQDNFKIPEKSSFMENEEYESIEVCQKILFQIELVRTDRDADYGMLVEAELAEDTEQEDELCVFISELTKNGLAHRKGLQVGDEILVINGKVVTDLDMVYVETLLQDLPAITLTVRSCRVERPINTTPLMEHADVYIDSMVCPPPPSQIRITDKAIGDLIVPAPNWVPQEQEGHAEDGGPQKDVAELSSQQIDNLLQGADQVTHFCRLIHQKPISDNMNVEEVVPVKPLSDAQKLRKVIMELIDTERVYVRDLNCLIERYLVPLKDETFLSGEDIEQLFGNIQEIVQFQKMFLMSLEECVELEPNFTVLSEPAQFRRILFSLGGSFLYYANHFKLYSSFCASHSKAQKILKPDGNSALREFLVARNPKQQHSATLESYLIKPIQRILKYPLLLQQLKTLTHPNTDEHHHLSEALRGMEAVAEHINEMQKIYEEYGAVFDDLVKCSKDTYKNLDLNVGELQMYGTVTWLNALDELGKIKKGVELLSTVFVFKAGVVLLVQERMKGKKKSKPAPPSRPPIGPMIESGNVTLYQTVIPVDQLQVRCTTHSDTERHGFWELVHCKSETEGRPEKVFQLASSLAAKNEFMKTMRNIIRESVRRMQLPTSKQEKKPQPAPPQQPYHPQQALQQQHSPQQGGTKRPDNLPPAAQQAWSLGKKGGKQLKQDMVRHSMDLDDKVAGFETESDFRLRSRTFSDLNNMDLQQSIGQDAQGSQSTIASERGSTSAKLLHSSNSPSNYSSTTTIHKDSLGSPIWKPRNAKKHVTVRSPISQEERTIESAIFAGQAYGDYSAEMIYDQPKAVQQQHQQQQQRAQQQHPQQPPPQQQQHLQPQQAQQQALFQTQRGVILVAPNQVYTEYEDTEC